MTDIEQTLLAPVDPYIKAHVQKAWEELTRQAPDVDPAKAKLVVNLARQGDTVTYTIQLHYESNNAS